MKKRTTFFVGYFSILLSGQAAASSIDCNQSKMLLKDAIMKCDKDTRCIEKKSRQIMSKVKRFGVTNGNKEDCIESLETNTLDAIESLKEDKDQPQSEAGSDNRKDCRYYREMVQTRLRVKRCRIPRCIDEIGENIKTKMDKNGVKGGDTASCKKALNGSLKRLSDRLKRDQRRRDQRTRGQRRR